MGNVERVPKKKLLLIDKSQILMDITKRILERDEYTVCCAAGIAVARASFLDFIPDGIILENDLPDGDGIGYCSELRRAGAAPILFLSDDKDDELPALRAGASDFLKKPFDPEILKIRLGALMAKETSQTGGRVSGSLVVYSPVSPNAERGAGASERQEDPQNQGRQVAGGGVTSYTRRLVTALAACLLIAVALLGLVGTLNHGSRTMDVSDEQVPLGDFALRAESERQQEDLPFGWIRFPNVVDITLPADTANVNFLLLNREKNHCYFIFEITLTDTSESLYVSDMVAPGTFVEEIELTRGLAKGEYRALVKATALSLEDLSPIGGAELEYRITAS